MNTAIISHLSDNPQLKTVQESIETMEMPQGTTIGGWVYILSNECMPGIYKIGMTTHEPENRAKEISQGTGIPMPFVVERAYFSEDPKEDEECIHSYLQEYRVNPQREFFKCHITEIEEAFRGYGLHSRDCKVEELADHYSVISFEKSNAFSLNELFEDEGLSVFGCKWALTRRMFQLAVRMVKSLNANGNSLVFYEGIAQPIIHDLIRRQNIHMEEMNAAGIYGPEKPLEF